jgi:hypothetical protein
VAKASLGGFELEARRPLLGVCESAVAGIAPAPPTNVVVAWEDGTRVTYPVATGLASAVAPSSPSLLGAVVQFGLGVIPVPLFGAGNRVRGPVVMHAEFFEANGDPLGSPTQNELVTFKTQLGYAGFIRAGLDVVPNA